MRIHVLTTKKGRRAHSFTYPLRVFSRAVKRAGLEVELFDAANAGRLFDCDVLGVVGDYFGLQMMLHQPELVTAWLSRARSQVPGLLWLDVTDGSGMLFEPAIAEVDLYAKKQLLKDRTLYETPYREREYHLDFFYQHHGETLPSFGELAQIKNHRGLLPEEWRKLRLSWNIGLGDYATFWGRARRLRPYVPAFRFEPQWAAAGALDRPLAISYRVGSRYCFAAVPFHRHQVREWVERVASARPEASIISEGTLPYRAYVRELGQARIAPSPFGWGEICWRDFEVLRAGALLFKPDLSHLETWPAYFEKDVTLCTWQWDGADFGPQLTQLLDEPTRAATLAAAGQARYIATLSPDFGPVFARHLKALALATLRARRDGPE